MPTPVLSGNQFVVNTSTGNTQDSPHTAALIDGRIAVVWRDIGSGQDTLKYKILNADGSVSVAETVLNANIAGTGFIGAAGGGDWLAVAASSDGGFAAVWQHRTSPTFTEDVYVTVVGDNGVAAPSIIANAGLTGGNQQLPDIATLNGGFVITWQDDNTAQTGAFTNTAVMAGLLDSSGGLIASGRISDDHGGDGASSVAARLNGLQFTYVWDDDLGDGSSPPEDGIYGSTVGIRFRVDQGLDNGAGQEFHIDPDVAYEGGPKATFGNYMTVWTHYNGTPGSYEIRGSINGSSSNFTVNTTTLTGSAHSPRVVGLKQGGFLVVWADGGASYGADYDVIGQLFSSTGVAIGSEFVITSDTVVNNSLSSLDATSTIDGRVLVTWDASGPATSGSDVFARFVDPRQGALSFTGGTKTFGDPVNEQIVGTDLGDSIDGGGGNDRMTGLLGNDIYYIDSLGDVIVEAAGQGTQDTVLGTANIRLDTMASAAGVEHLVLQGTANLTAIGHNTFNTITGNSGNNYLAGLGGNDTVNGGAGNDRIQGNEGKDTLTGGTGDDQFIYTFVADSGGTQPRRDVITDFNQISGNNDWIDLSLTDANGAIAGNQAFTFIGTAAFTGAAGELRYFQDVANNRTIIEGNVRVTADSPGAELSIELTGLFTLTAGANNTFDIIL